MLDLRQVRTFVHVAREGSFTRAAQSLNYAQSSVTAQVQQLELELGVPLFDRLPRRLELTAVGRDFLPHALRLLLMAEEAAQVVHCGGEAAGPLTISASESVLTYRLPDVLRRFQEVYPRVSLSLHAASLCEFGPPVQMGVDIGISISERIQDAALVTHPLRAERILAVVSRDHPLATRRRVSAQELAAEQLLLTEPACTYRAVFERTLAAQGARPGRTLELTSVEAIKQCAHARMGVAVLPEMVMADDLRAGSLVSLRWQTTDLKMYTQLVRRRDKWFSPAMRAFWETAVEVLGKSRMAA